MVADYMAIVAMKIKDVLQVCSMKCGENADRISGQKKLQESQQNSLDFDKKKS